MPFLQGKILGTILGENFSDGIRLYKITTYHFYCYLVCRSFLYCTAIHLSDGGYGPTRGRKKNPETATGPNGEKAMDRDYLAVGYTYAYFWFLDTLLQMGISTARVYAG